MSESREVRFHCVCPWTSKPWIPGDDGWAEIKAAERVRFDEHLATCR